MTLREICQEMTGETETSKVIPAAAPILFNFPFDFYDESGKQEFQEKWIRHFYMREIGFETIDYFLLRLQDKFDTILPYYNGLFKAAKTEFNPLENEIISEQITYTKDNTKTTTGNDETTTNSNTDSTTNTNGTSNSKFADSEYPQGDLTDFENNHYLTSANKNDTTDSSESTGNSNSTGSATTNIDHTESDKGETTENRKANNTKGNQSEMLASYYKAVQNITNKFYNECEDLFMQLWI